MRTKWYLGAFIIVLAFLGVSVEKSAVVNQEIEVQYSDQNVTSAALQKTLQVVKQRLLSAGVTNIQVNQSSTGTLRITYYSTIDVTSVQQLFNEDENIAILFSSSEKDKSSIPSKEKHVDYEFNISEIQTTQDIAIDFEGLVIDSQIVNNQFYDIVHYTSLDRDYVLQNLANKEKVAYQFYQKRLLTYLPNRFIPEVRAGPKV
ncbi:hypothetical protein [Patiriisocius hiemis]|uniref:Uncharacterized protein n=1 Tax=Patiriisocius hiemis TaxID=3075604 RepID=A0ABU2YEE7_9FLAO|nr:hypothetical protein [Constantimarinum sp. W242]MDT0556112.1 hypothetical protein [Constantimarinum sp. W242]